METSKDRSINPAVGLRHWRSRRSYSVSQFSRFSSVFVLLFSPCGFQCHVSAPTTVRVLFDHPCPFALAHGGFQIQIEQTKKALEDRGLDVEWLRWWDGSQRGDLIHYFGRPLSGYIHFAHQKGMKVVMLELLTGPGSRPPWARFLQRMLMTSAKRLLPAEFTGKLAWDSYRLADGIVALTEWEKRLMVEMFSADPSRVDVVPNGVEEVFFPPSNAPSEAHAGKWLVCTATITERKRVLELAQAAVRAGVPVWIVGEPYSQLDPYFLRFREVVARSNGLVRYEGGVRDRQRLAEIYREARGFVLLSTMETLSLSALEAAASGCPLLLSDLPWARCSFESHASYCPVGSIEQTVGVLRRFYRDAPGLPPPPRPLSWREVATELESLYTQVLRPEKVSS